MLLFRSSHAKIPRRSPPMIPTPRRSLLILVALVLPLLGFQVSHEHPSAPPLPAGTPASGEMVMNVPLVDAGADTLEARGAAERASLSRFKVYHDFRFTDRLPESGI